MHRTAVRSSAPLAAGAAATVARRCSPAQASAAPPVGRVLAGGPPGAVGARVPARRRRARQRAAQRRRAPGTPDAAAGRQVGDARRRGRQRRGRAARARGVADVRRRTGGCTSTSRPDGDNRVVRMRYGDGRLGRTARACSTGIPRGRPTTTAAAGVRTRPACSTSSTGDAGDDVTRPRTTDSLGGKILRLTPDGGVPDGNPFGNRGLDLRPPQRPGPRLGRRRAAVGHASSGRTPATSSTGSDRGRNYGWPDVEGGDGDGPVRRPVRHLVPDVVRARPAASPIAGGRAWVGALAGAAPVLRAADAARHAGAKIRHFHDTFGRIRTVAAGARRLAVDHHLSNRDGRGDPAATDDRVIRITL